MAVTYAFNTAVAELMKLTNTLAELRKADRAPTAGPPFIVHPENAMLGLTLGCP